MRAELAIEPEQEKGEADSRYREQVAAGCRERAPYQHWHAIDRHARRAHAYQRDHEVCGANRARGAEQDHAECIDIDVWPGVVFETRERHIAEPARVGCLSKGEARIKEDAGE